MDFNLLLAYLTEVGYGSWEQFKNACRSLAEADDNGNAERKVSIWNLAQRNLSRLGHAEFQFGDNSIWAIAPPVLVSASRSVERTAILCGARNKPFVDEVRKACAEREGRLSVCVQREGPDVILGENIGLWGARNLAAALDILHTDVSRLFTCLPSLDAMLSLCPEEKPPIGWRVAIFDEESLEWKEAAQANHNGFYCYTVPWRPPEYRIKDAGRVLRTPPYVGIYYVLRRAQKQVMSYESDRRTLLVRSEAKMPELYERAATLCSGFLPIFEPASSRECFTNIPRRYAEIMAVRLGQKLGG